MTLTLEIINTTPGMPSHRQRTFREDGGRIGRDPASDWVLPHNKVSSRHAVITYRSGVFYIEDRSRNGVFLNSTTNRLTPGRPQALQAGDVIFIEPYEIQVSVSEDTGDSALGFDPHADPFAARPAAPPAFYEPSPVDPEQPHADDLGEVDPLKLLGGGGAGAGAPRATPPRDVLRAEELERRPLAGHYQPPAIVAPPVPPPPSRASAPGPELIPEDYDPLADAIVPDVPTPAPPPRAARPSVPRAKAQPPIPAPDVSDPFAPLADAIELPSDPFARPDDDPTPLPAPKARPVTPRPLAEQDTRDLPPVPPAKTPAPKMPAAPSEPPAPIAAAPIAPAPIAPAPFVPASIAPAPMAPAPADPAPRVERPPDPAVVEPPAPRHEERAAAPAASGPHATIDLSAVLAGAGLANVAVTPEMAENFGKILSVVVAGVMDLLRARQQVKDELRMRQTQFRPADNNPLKFSANVDDALHNLLVKRNPAYLKPVEAFDDAFDDLRDHQLAMLAGLRVAFEAMLSEFDPARLEEQFDRQMKKGSLLSVPAKLRYWDAYRERTRQMLQDMDATFRKWFGEEFVKAYEEQLERLELDRGDRRP